MEDNQILRSKDGTIYNLLSNDGKTITMRNTEHNGGITIARASDIGIVWEIVENKVEEIVVEVQVVTKLSLFD